MFNDITTDPRSNVTPPEIFNPEILFCVADSGLADPLDQGSGQVVCVSLAIILLAFVGASPQNIYSFVSAINIQMRLNIIYNP